MTNNEYHARPEVSNSDLKLFAESPRKLELKKLGQLEQEQTQALALGSALHKLVLERESFNSEYAVLENCDRRTKAGKAYYDEFCQKNAGKEILSADIFAQICAMEQSIYSIPRVRELLSSGVAEKPFFAELNGAKCKCKVDFLSTSANALIDVKTTSSLKDFKRAMGAFGYFTQASFYADILEKNGIQIDSVFFIVVEKTAPFLTGIFRIDYADLDGGREIYSKRLEKLKFCRENGFYPPLYENIALNYNGDFIYEMELCVKPSFYDIERG